MMRPPSLMLRNATPFLYACRGLDALDTAVAVSAIAELCTVRATYGRVPRWWHLVAGAELTAPDPAAAMRARGIAPDTARIAAARIQALSDAERRRGARVRWVGIVDAHAVPDAERPELRVIGELAHTAAVASAADTEFDVRTVLHSLGRGRWMAMLAGSIGRGTLDEDDTVELLGAAGAAIAAAHPDIDAWGTRAVGVHAPAEHPGVPFACVVLRVESPAALAELVSGTLVHDALDSAGAGRYDVAPPP